MREAVFGVFALAVAGGVMAFQATRDYPTGLFDIYPLYYGARAWLATGSAYDLKAVAPPEHAGLPLLELGNAYPFPAVIFLLPLSIFAPSVAGVLWSGLVALCLTISVRLVRGSWWLLLYLPLVEAVRIEQYTALVVAVQLMALWSWRTNRWWWLGLMESLMLTKPNQGALFALVLLLSARNWKQFAVWAAVIWGGSLLLSPRWPVEWLPVAFNNVAAVPRPVYWQFAILLVPLLLVRDWLSLSLVAPVLAGQFRDVYVAAPLPLGVTDLAESRWLAPVAILWLYVSALVDPAWGTGLALVLPVVVLAGLRWWRCRHPQKTSRERPLSRYHWYERWTRAWFRSTPTPPKSSASCRGRRDD
jgi:lipid-A-disaccharide synthase-like uncharacterized protein